MKRYSTVFEYYTLEQFIKFNELDNSFIKL